MRKWSSARQGERPQKKLKLLTPWSWTPSLQNCEKINVYWLSHPVYGICYGSPSKLIQWCSSVSPTESPSVTRDAGPFWSCHHTHHILSRENDRSQSHQVSHHMLTTHWPEKLVLLDHTFTPYRCREEGRILNRGKDPKFKTPALDTRSFWRKPYLLFLCQDPTIQSTWKEQNKYYYLQVALSPIE